ncbi:inhibitor of nuclear factor kappa-B kinase subunit epsilon isoform X1 [Carcharodon carcharias]|uniref:inhibitor of nuclear factor kappa-B kinase subunit epsilon isoform X1 n=1 Tax=Carcharodon carcharias TaxID=13397 RepID=UPI001B7EA577|nr:inhibitor of nuclear factor kappa-B kinase subunit epsilon isoform X1 [Carcharodon carcharias]XP_041051560.1 inhibitor of nuclear factor kappa-B kinase subunit epsilon isoform X1 [Carcharodon carcharias]
MQSTANYLWSLSDVLGQGATASVYKARHKKTGDQYAVKVFNHVSYLRPYEVQMREFEMLRKLNHKNIVKLFAVEEVGVTKQKVLVMEYCAGGSLLNVLEESENAFGLSEAEFLIVLGSVVGGMNQLRENGVVHRDIKPGNIMRMVGDDGQSVYKLTDFGAARELEDDEKFMSLYGTEEYLHPDMYERAVLRKPQKKAYGVTVDLWSIGVTFYQAATGSLPFIPYGGPRKNKEMMYKITTEKPEGAIAGVQRSDFAPVEWSYELPVSCRLSKGLKDLLVPILASILEADQAKCWGFDQFFAEANDILHRTVIHIFSLQQATMLKVYIHSYNTIKVLLEAISKQTDISPQNQEFIYEGHRLELELTQQVQLLPKTTEDRPTMLVSTEPKVPIGVIYKEPEIPVFPPKFDIINDANLSKIVISAVHKLLRITKSLMKCQDFILRGTYWILVILKEECRKMLQQFKTLNLKLSFCQNTMMKIQTLYELLPQTNLPEMDNLHMKLQSALEFLVTSSHSVQSSQKQLDLIATEWSKSSNIHHEDSTIGKVQVLLDKVFAIHHQLRKDRLKMKLSYNEEQIHKFEKIKMGMHAKKVQMLVREDCAQKYLKLLVSIKDWMRIACETRKQLRSLNNQSMNLGEDLENYEAHLNKILDLGVPRLQGEQQTGTKLPASTESSEQKCMEMIIRMKQLKQEMEGVLQELEHNNLIIERLAVQKPQGV